MFWRIGFEGSECGAVESGDLRFFCIITSLQDAGNDRLAVSSPVKCVEVGIPEQGPANCRCPGYGTALLTILVLGDLVVCLKQQQESLFISECLLDLQRHLDRQIASPRNDGIERLTVFSDGGSKRPLAEIAFLQIPADYLARMDAFQYVNSASHSFICKYTKCKRICLQIYSVFLILEDHFLSEQLVTEHRFVVDDVGSNAARHTFSE